MQKVKIDITLLIVLLTGVAYAIAYTFEFSYQDYYKLPRVFIDLNITTLTRSLFVTLLGACLIFLLLNIITITKIKLSIKDISVIILMLFIILLIAGALIMGKLSASQKEEYMVLKKNKELFVVVTSYSGNLIIAPLDIKTETMSPEFQAVEITSMKDTQIITFKNGLKVKELKSSKEFKEQLN